MEEISFYSIVEYVINALNFLLTLFIIYSATARLGQIHRDELTHLLIMSLDHIKTGMRHVQSRPYGEICW